MQADELLPLDTVIVAPTSTSGPPFTFRPIIEVHDQPAYVLVDQIAAAAVERLGTSAGRLSAAELRAVDEALTIVLGL